MKEIDITNKVMNRVVSFEKRRIAFWIGRAVLVLGGLLTILGISLWLFARQVWEMQVLDLLSLFGEDREIIKEFWQDTVWLIWEELPHRMIYISIFVILILIIFVIFSKSKFGVIKEKMKNLKNYKPKV